ncbi:unnamed protein product [Amoebophrya sp. A25]|nr:unnamed protein product [Amoebophrya sp. A25]|eukprot:GSA25T00020805001.1
MIISLPIIRLFAQPDRPGLVLASNTWVFRQSQVVEGRPAAVVILEDMPIEVQRKKRFLPTQSVLLLNILMQRARRHQAVRSNLRVQHHMQHIICTRLERYIGKRHKAMLVTTTSGLTRRMQSQVVRPNPQTRSERLPV